MIIGLYYPTAKTGYLLIFHSCFFKVFHKLPDWQSCLQRCVADVPSAASILVEKNVDVAAQNVPVASAVAVNSAVAAVISAFGDA
jgi:hypothetical protein